MKGRVDHLLGLSVPLITLSAPAAAQVSDAELAEYGVTVGTIASEVEAPWGLPAEEIPDLPLETGTVDVVVPEDEAGDAPEQTATDSLSADWLVDSDVPRPLPQSPPPTPPPPPPPPH